MSKKDTFTQEIYLPSRGLLNANIPEGKVVQRCMMLEDQKFLAGANIDATSKSRSLIERTLVSPEKLDINELTPNDTMYLLIKLRVLSYGNMYKFRTKCPECGKKIDVEIDLSQLDVLSLEEDMLKDNSVVLPHSGDTVYTRILKNKDLDRIQEEAKRRRRKFKSDESYETVLRIAAMIEKIELTEPNKAGDKVLTHPVDIEAYVERITDYDATAIVATSDIPFGVDTSKEVMCPQCREFIDVGVYFGAGFFRPQYDKSSR